MIKLNKAQRRALKAVFDRCPNYPEQKSAAMIAQSKGWSYRLMDASVYRWWHPHFDAQWDDAIELVAHYKYALPITYRQFRATVAGGHDCIMVPWQGMWLGIEKDGYTHS